MAHRGNWFEEQVLESTTGIRYYPDPKDRSKQLLTKARVIEHTEQLPAKEYKSVMSSCITNQLEHPNYKTLQDRVGPRKAQLEADLKRQVDEEFKKKQSDDYTENRRVKYVSDAMENFSRADFEPTLNTKNTLLTRVPTFNADYCSDTPITFYQDAVKRGTANFPTTFVGAAGTNPFLKSSAFSADIKTEQTVKKSESNERPRPLPTVREYGTLRELRARLIEHTRGLETSGFPGSVVRTILDAVWRGGGELSTSSSVHIEAFINGLYSSLNFLVEPHERKALLAAYESSEAINTVSLIDVSDFIRGSLTPRSLELIDMVLASLAATENDYTEGFVSESVILSRYSGPPSVDQLLSNLRLTNGQVSVDDFFEYYTDVSAELVDNGFEALLRTSWGI